MISLLDDSRQRYYDQEDDFYFSLRNSEQKMLPHVNLRHLHLSHFLFQK